MQATETDAIKNKMLTKIRPINNNVKINICLLFCVPASFVCVFVSACSIFFLKISDKRFRVRMTSQAEEIRFIMKVRMSEIS
jgi:hypothetical protein